MIRSLIKIQQYPQFGHMTTSTLQLREFDKTLLVVSWIEIITSEPLCQNTFILTSSRVANQNSAGIVKIEIMLIEITFKGSAKNKKN